MAVHNSEIATLFERYAELLEIQGANPFRVRAYRNAALTVRGLGTEVARMIADGTDLTELQGIGDDLAAKMHEIVDTGRLQALERLAGQFPEHLADLDALPGLGPRRIRALHDALGIGSLDDLEHAARQGRIRGLRGFGAKSERNILHAIEAHRDSQQRTRLADAERIAEPLLAHLAGARGVKQAIIAGSYRRRRETVGDVDILVSADTGNDVMERLTGYDSVSEVVSRGDTRATVILDGGLQVDLRVVPEASYGAALHYFTGNRAHNIAVRVMGQRRGLKINEYGVFEGERRIAGATEASVYEQVGLVYIEPELRENRGELEAAAEDRLPALVALEDIRGDLHCHTDATDGRDGAEAMARAAKALGREYLAITDHTRRLRVANGLTPGAFAEHLDALEALDARLDDIRVLRSAEVDILEDGSLDLPDDVLARMDVVVCAVHYGLGLPRAKQTDRLLRALDSPHCQILAHPTCRILGERQPIDANMGRILRAAAETGCALEINAQPGRLDLPDVLIREALGQGARFVVATDAHSTEDLALMRLGLDQARRGWLTAADVLNTHGVNDFLAALRRR
ncbi:DNA polymerase/3'-5' exonuclease PolX [wastewater metagenome]|uniref:DNA polymerase beta n=2 Tax=unclassified sequences TaxID=12908 RepID=A0A5B8RIX9_9ZZZZ|nr:MULTISPECIES: DNA polymerase/3'-5' exonuclease PolX [Arhodomonas]MCS4503109.1 DNA polymerase/3'-5' exonuclease PolX [Arhodomonas aquaeolei]QEA06747.1 DNA polymerase/3'-5' exonuclease PolX [uncultured organism]